MVPSGSRRTDCTYDMILYSYSFTRALSSKFDKTTNPIRYVRSSSPNDGSRSLSLDLRPITERKVFTYISARFSNALRLSPSRRSTLAAKRRRFQLRLALIINLHRSSRKPAAGKRAAATEEDSFSRVITGGGLIRRHRGAVQAREARPCNERKTRGKKSREPFVLNDSQSPAESLGKFADSSAN